MPYIVGERRFAAADVPTNEGELNFAITTLVDDYLSRKPEGLRYAGISEVVAALECAKLEFYRRVGAPYEDKAILKNGDVYLCNQPTTKGA